MASYVISLIFGLLTITPVHSFAVPDLQSYDNVWVDPSYIIAKNFSNTTVEAQKTIVAWADELAGQGPWSVINKTVTPPSGNKHDYMSWAPYSWPNCTGVGNTTELTPEQVWVTCPYYTRDGEFNPDRLLVNDTGAFSALADAILYNSLAWSLTGHSNYSTNVANWVNTWFLDPATYMTPNLNYAQMERGPDGQNGTHTGVLDFKCMAKLVSGILILRKGNSSDWTTSIDTPFVSWIQNYTTWLETATIAIQEEEAGNNHGSFYFNQLAALKVLVDDIPGAQTTLTKYFTGIYQAQIIATGEQPLEASRTRPYHYRAYNLAAMITNMKLALYTSTPNITPTTPTSTGGTIPLALTFAIGVTGTSGDNDTTEFYPTVGAVAQIYGDPKGEYAKFLKGGDAGYDYPAKPWFLWDWKVGNGGLVDGGSEGGSTGGSGNGSGGESGVRVGVRGLRVFGVGFVRLFWLHW